MLATLSNRLAAWVKVLTRATRLLFSALILVVPLAEWLMVSASRGQPASWFGLPRICGSRAIRSSGDV